MAKIAPASTSRGFGMFRSDQLDIDQAMVLVVDVQEKLLPLIRGHERIVAVLRNLLDGAKLFDLPVVATEQYSKGIGHTVGPIAEKLTACDAKIIEKSTFSVWGEDAAREAMLAIDRPQVLVGGIEAHVCVQQTVLDLLSRDYKTYVFADAIGSRGKIDYKSALRRMTQAGALVTTVESALFELCRRCDSPPFKGLLDIIKRLPPR